MPSLLNFLLRALLVAAGLVFALSLAFVFLLLFAVWSLRAAWGRVTGRPVRPFVMRMGPGHAFEEAMRRAGRPPRSRTPRADAAAGPRAPASGASDITDVQPRDLR